MIETEGNEQQAAQINTSMDEEFKFLDQMLRRVQTDRDTHAEAQEAFDRIRQRLAVLEMKASAQEDDDSTETDNE